MPDDRKPMTPAEFDAACRELWSVCPYLSETSGRRTKERNAAAGGKPGSKHVLGMARDFSAPNRTLLSEAMSAARRLGFWVEVHDVGSGLHLHVQALPPGPVPKDWMEKYGAEVGADSVES